MTDEKFIIFIGPVGSGKDTQADILADKLGFSRFKTTQVLEFKFNNAEPDDLDYEKMLEAKKQWNEGILLDSEWVSKTVSEATEELINSGVKGIIYSGSPRTLPEAKTEIAKMESLLSKESILVFKVDLSAEESIKRNSQRLFCENSHPIDPNIAKTNPATCSVDGGKIIRRDLDKPEVIKVRLDEYYNRTEPILDYLKELGLEMININGEQSIEKVAEDIWVYFES